MPRVALFCTNFLPYSQTFVYEQIRQHRRYEVDVFAWRRMNPERFPHPRVHVANPAYIATRYSPRFARAFRERGYDVVHAHFGPGGTYAAPYAQRFGTPLLVTFHGYDVPLLSSWERAHPVHWHYAFYGPRLLREMSLGLCASRELRELLIERGVPEEKLVVHRLGIDLERFRPVEPDDATLRVIMVGRFVPKKGFEYGLRAFARAASQSERAMHLTVVGDGEGRQRLHALAAALGIADRVHFAGSRSPAQVAEALQQSHVLLAPSVVTADGDRESGLLVVKEASACGTVPIGTIHGGIPDSIDDGDSGFLVPERDVEAMADRLQQLAQDPARRRAMAQRARAKMEREFDNRERVAALEARYDQATGHRRQP